MTAQTGAQLIWESLGALGVESVFGVPGTQTVELYEALRRSGLRAVLPSSELAAAFMANGYARLGNRVAVVCTIPGPGFTYALTGLAEARLDSAPLLHLTLAPARSPGRRFQLQAIDQVAIARPLVKEVVVIESADQIAERLAHAVGVATGGEPGPVLVQVEPAALAQESQGSLPPPIERATPGVIAGQPERLAQSGALLAGAHRPMLLVGRGAVGAAGLVLRVAERYHLPMVATPSARGVVPEDHPLVLGFDGHRGDIGSLNAALAQADLILVVGCKLSHSDSNGFALQLPAERLVHVDADESIPGSNYPCRLAVCATPETALAHWLAAGDRAGASQWTDAAIAEWRARIQTATALEWPEPVIDGVPGGAAAGFFSALRRALPRDGVLVTDSGLHQVLARRYFDVFAPGGLVFPTDFQSMGFGLPAALGAKLAQPARPVVALLGDGGFAMSGFELATAVRERIPVTVIVFNDGQLNLIRLQQLRDYGRAYAVETRAPDLATFAASVGAAYVCLDGEPEATLRSACGADAPTLVEVRVGDSAALRGMRARSLARSAVRQAIGPRLLSWLKRALR